MAYFPKLFKTAVDDYMQDKGNLELARGIKSALETILEKIYQQTSPDNFLTRRFPSTTDYLRSSANKELGKAILTLRSTEPIEGIEKLAEVPESKELFEISLRIHEGIVKLPGPYFMFP